MGDNNTPAIVDVECAVVGGLSRGSAWAGLGVRTPRQRAMKRR
jgi:hypothetical protein